jgi:hypothetical protein
MRGGNSPKTAKCLEIGLLLRNPLGIDEDWSAKRFRRAGFIKNMKRPKEYRLTERGARPAKAPPG